VLQGFTALHWAASRAAGPSSAAQRGAACLDAATPDLLQYGDEEEEEEEEEEQEEEERDLAEQQQQHHQQQEDEHARESNVHVLCARALLQATGGRGVNARDELGRTPLALAAEAGRCCMAMLRLLLAQGAHLETTDLLGRRPLHVAAMQGDERCVQALLRAGLRPIASSCLPAPPSPPPLSSRSAICILPAHSNTPLSVTRRARRAMAAGADVEASCD
jgi:ankyrin repeat protein